MVTFKASDDLVRVLDATTDDIVLVNDDGRVLGVVQRPDGGVWPPETDDRIRELKARAGSTGPWRSTAEVLTRLRSGEGR